LGGGIVMGAAVECPLNRRVGVQGNFATGLVICAAGMALMSLVGAENGYGLLLVALPVIGIGNALAMFTAFNVILDVLPASQTAAGTALARTLQQVGSLFGVAVMGSVLNSAYRSEMSARLAGLPTQVIDVAQGSVAGAALVASHLPAPLGVALFGAARDAYSTGMSDVLRVSAGLMIAAALLIATFMRRSRSAYDPQRERRASWPDAHAAAE